MYRHDSFPDAAPGDATFQPAKGSRGSYSGPHKVWFAPLDTNVGRKSPICAYGVMHEDIKIVHSVTVGFEILEPPGRCVDSRQKIDVDVSRLGAIASPPLHFWRDANVNGDDGRLQAGGEMKRTFIECANLAGLNTL